MPKRDHSFHRIIAGVLFLLAGLAGVAGAAERDARPTLTLVGPAATPPTIDGHLDEECWQSAAQSTGFVLNERPVPAEEQTTVYVTYDQRHLYVAFECLESQMDRLAASVTERDGPVFRDDVVELFLDPNRDRFTYYQFAVNARGTRFDLKGDAAGGNPRWDAPWNAAVARGDDRWWAELAIPFSSLDLHLEKTGSTWGINFAREQQPKGEVSVWSFTGGAFARPDRFGEVEGLAVDFSRYAYGVELQDTGDQLIGSNVLKARITSPTAKQARVGLLVYLPGGQAKRSEVNVNLTPARPTTVTLPYELPREGDYRMVLHVRDRRSGEVLRGLGVPVSVPPLLELMLFPNHYRQEVVLRPRLNVRQADLKAFRLTARLLKNGTLVPPVREKPFFVTKTPLIPFDLSKAGPGEYEIQVTLAPQRAGAGLVKETLRFTHAPVRSSAVGTRPLAVSIGADNSLLLRGQRFFPLGIYRYSLSERSLREIREAGFNLVQATHDGSVEETWEVLNRVEAHGLKAWVPLGDAMRIPEGDEEKAGRLRDIVSGLRSHPALLCWESIDEPAWGSKNLRRDAEELYRGYRVMRSLDPDHPVWTNHAPRNTVDELALFNRATDIAGADIYPVPEPQTQSDLPNKRITVVGDETAKNILAVLNRKPVFMVLQGFAWADLSRHSGGSDEAVYPSFAQSRFMAYQAVVRGARGLLYWGTHSLPRPSPFWNSLRRLVHELSQMHDVLAGPDAGDYVKVLAGGSAIKTLIRRHAKTGDRFIIAINTSARPVDARLQIPRAMPKVGWRVLFERRQVTGNPIVDYFEPYAVHIYTASRSFPQERFLELPTVTEVQRPRPEDLTQPGNLLVNPGFEYTEDEETPVGWSYRPPFSGAMTTEVRRSGKYSVTLQGRSAESQPLWIQSGIATEAGRRYRFSAQVRTRPAGTRYRLYAEWTGEKGYLGGQVPELPMVGTERWREASLEFTVNHPEATQLYVVLQVLGEGQAWFDDVRLEELR
ncbi:MAG: hypothetical protein GX774_21230 [Armatimonadetes bacterium]|nr:hypothetical protein [Armatimonadota bacterium]